MFLELKKVNFSYNGRRDVLKDISFSVKKSQTIAVVGASGSGKSTILRLVAGLLPDEGDEVAGSISIDGKSPDDYRKSGKLSFMFQQPTLFPNLTVRENIELPFKINGQLQYSQIKELITIVGLNGFEDYLPKRLSGGMKTRVSLARSFATKPELLLLDEPFSSLDVAWKDALYYELKLLIKDFGTTVVLVTHDIEEALELGDTIICLGIEGKVLLVEQNTKNDALYSLIGDAIIKDHKLRKKNEKKS